MSMVETEALFAVLTVLAIGLVTPGPNNVTCVVHAGVHGARSNVVLIAGMLVGFLTVHIVSGLLVEQVNEGSLLWVALHWFGLLFLSLIALRLLTLKPASIRQAIDDEGLESLLRLQDGTVPRLGFRTGVMMQFVNGKEWALVITIMRQALDGFGGGLSGMLLIASLTCTGGVAAMSLWSVGGGRLTGVLRDDVGGRRVLVGLGLLVVFLLLALGLRGP
tara:strand:+ start:593 stop:1249 length:657 start_codon:yes stop_codon:yes gene_type:complete